MKPQTQRTTMKQYRAMSASGAEFSRTSRLEDLQCAVIIYPLEDGGGLFKQTTVDWYTNLEQAERHARDWRRFGHHVEVVIAAVVTDC